MALTTKFLASVACAIALASSSIGAPAGSPSLRIASTSMSATATGIVVSQTINDTSPTSSAPPVYETVSPASDDPNYVAWAPGYTGTPEPTRGPLGSNVIGPQNVALDLQNPDILAPPTTDHGSVYV